MKVTVHYGIMYKADHKINLEGYVDSDWEGSAINRKSTSGMISWFSRKQSYVALSTVEVEYVRACSASCEAVLLRKLLSDSFDLQLDDTCIHCDNQSCVKFLKNPVFHEKSKHIQIKYHYIRDMVQWGAVKLRYVVTKEQIADVLTKPLARVKF